MNKIDYVAASVLLDVQTKAVGNTKVGALVGEAQYELDLINKAAQENIDTRAKEAAEKAAKEKEEAEAKYKKEQEEAALAAEKAEPQRGYPTKEPA